MVSSCLIHPDLPAGRPHAQAAGLLATWREDPVTCGSQAWGQARREGPTGG